MNAPPTGPDTPGRNRILLMEDDPLVRADLGAFLTENGYEVSSCATVQHAKALWLEDPFDLVITDIFIRENGALVSQGGITLLGWLNLQGDVPVIAITGTTGFNSQDQYLFNMRALGADLGMIKPLDKPALLDGVQRLLAPGWQKKRF